MLHVKHQQVTDLLQGRLERPAMSLIASSMERMSDIKPKSAREGERAEELVERPPLSRDYGFRGQAV